MLIIRITVMELLLECIYVGWRFGIDYLPIEENIKLLLHNFTTGVFIIVSLIQIFLLILIVVRWINEYYELQKDEIIVWKGVITKKGQSYPYTNIQSITVNQSLLGRVVGFGTVILYIPALGQDLVFHEVPSPYSFTELIKSRLPKIDSQRFIFKRK